MATASQYFKSPIVALIGLAVVSGCATPDPGAAVDELGALVADRLPEPVVWRTGGPEDVAVDARIAALLSAPLTAESAVAVALLSNRSVQERYAALGIAQADLVQAGLLQNPMLDVMVRPSTEDGTNLEFGLVQNFVSLLMRPARQKVAAAIYEETRLGIAHELVAFAADVKAAYYAHLSARNSRDTYGAIASTAQDGADLAAAFHRAGNLSELERADHQADAEEAGLAVIDADRAVAETEIDLVEILGLSADVEWSMPRRLATVPDSAFVTDGLEYLALRQRFDLQALRSGLRAAADQLGLTADFRLLEDMELGVSAEREPDGAWLIGPSLEIPLPLFDQGQTRLTQAELSLRQQQDALAAKEMSIQADIRRAVAILSFSRSKAERLRDTVLPLKQNITRLTLAEYNYMLVGAFEVLATEQHENETYLEYLDTLAEYWSAHTALEAAVGGRLPLPIEQTSQTPPSQGDAS
jgi:outer membrane protein, heavy metal efflux system